MQKRDPLATSIWKFYSQTKSQLPNKERMENLTWRLMVMNLKKRKEMAEKQRSAEQAGLTSAQPSSFEGGDGEAADLDGNYRQAQLQQQASTQSGISQLRASQDASQVAGSDAMNLDDFGIPNTFDSPSALLASTFPTSDDPLLGNTNGVTIKNRKGLAQAHSGIPYSSVPANHDPDCKGEFGYVQKHVRKTSIDDRKTRKRPAHFSPQIPAAGTDDAGVATAEMGLNDYNLEMEHFNDVSSSLHFSIDNLPATDDPILHSAGPYQQHFAFSPVGSPINSHGPFSMYNHTGPPLASSHKTNNDYYSPPASGFQSNASTPQPLQGNEDMYFDAHQRLDNFTGSVPSGLSTSLQAGRHWGFGPEGNASSGFTAPTSTPLTGFTSAPTFNMQQQQQQHVNPSHVLHSEFSGHQMTGLGGGRGGESTFHFGADSDIDEEEVPASINDPSYTIRPPHFEGPDEMNLQMKQGIRWSSGNLAGVAANMAARYPRGPLRKQVAIGGENVMQNAPDWTNTALPRGASVGNFSTMKNDPLHGARLPRNSSTPNALHIAQHGIPLNSSPGSPLDSGAASAMPSQPSSPGGSKSGESNQPTRCTNCFTQKTPLWRRSPEGQPLCNACGLFLKLHNVDRPLSLKTDVIKKRNRGSNTTGNTNSNSTSTKPNKKASRKNSTNQSPAATTPPAAKESSARDSASPQSMPGSGDGNTTTASTPASTHAPPLAMKAGVVAIAAKPPSMQAGATPTTSTGATASSALATSLPTRNSTAATSKRQRRQSKASVGAAGAQMPQFQSIDGSEGQENSVEDTTGQQTPRNPTGFAPPPPGGVPNVSAMGAPEIAGQQGRLMVMAGNGGATGQPRWDWLTMSL